MACGIYVSVASKLLRGYSLQRAIEIGLYEAMEFYREKEEYLAELSCFSRLMAKDFEKLPVEDIKSSGYVIDTLEAAFWCLLNTRTYESCVLKAVNLGKDTDTVAAVAGGLAGLTYGYEAIPVEWREKIVRKEYIVQLSNNFYRSLSK